MFECIAPSALRKYLADVSHQWGHTVTLEGGQTTSNLLIVEQINSRQTQEFFLNRFCSGWVGRVVRWLETCEDTARRSKRGRGCRLNKKKECRHQVFFEWMGS
jgi:hypothetical protein